MSNRVAQRYAQALYEAAVDQKKLEEVCSDIKYLKEIYFSSKDFNRFCNMPSLQLSIRLNVLRDIFASKTSKLTENFLMLLARKRRLNLLDVICQQFDNFFAEKHNIQKISIKSSHQLSADVVQEISSHMKTKLHKDIVPHFTTDPSLLGGVRIQVNDNVYDSTIKSKLDKLRQTILSTG